MSYLKMRFFALVLGLLGMGAMLMPSGAYAQTADVDWEDAGIASFDAFPTGTSVTGSDGTVATVVWETQTNGGSFVPAFGADFLNFFGGSVGGQAAPLLLSFNNGEFDPADRVVVTITLSRSVFDLNFVLSDIDNGNFQDAMEVYYDDDLTGTFTNAAADTSFWTAGSAIQRTNNATVNGWTGAANSAQASTTGNLEFDFGTTRVRRIQIVYFSNDNATGDPGSQFSTLSDLTYLELSADLSLTKQLLGSAPPNGGFATWRLTVTSAADSEATANSVAVRDNLPADFVFDSAVGDGSFNPANGEWSVGTLAPGQSATIDIAGEITAATGATVTNTAEIITSSVPDPDSITDNAAVIEDDFASDTFVVAPTGSGTPPALPCPVGETLFDWDGAVWPGGSLNNSYPLASFGTIEFDIVSDGTFVSRTSFGGAVPRLTTAVSGGLDPLELGLAFNKNNDNRTQQAVTTVTLPRVFTGAQFSVFDIDRSGSFEDRVTVFGLLNGVRVNAVLTDGPSNVISGPSIIGSSGAGDTTANGTGVFTFLDPIDTIIIEYGSGPGAPADPGNQSIAIHDFTFCTPAEPIINVSKVSSVVSDPVNGTTNAKAIPGATIEYLITVSNTGLGPTDPDTVVVWDDGPADAKFCLIGRAGGPAIYADPASNSGLSYNFVSIGSGLDDIEFSNNDASNFAYTPVADGDDCDENVTDFRISPGGAFAAGGNFTLRVRYIVK